jgi:hypothetical protein
MIDPSPWSGPASTGQRNVEAERVDAIVSEGPHGAIALAGTATAIVIGLWFAFYFLVFMPRGVIQ